MSRNGATRRARFPVRRVLSLGPPTAEVEAYAGRFFILNFPLTGARARISLTETSGTPACIGTLGSEVGVVLISRLTVYLKSQTLCCPVSALARPSEQLKAREPDGRAARAAEPRLHAQHDAVCHRPQRAASRGGREPDLQRDLRARLDAPHQPQVEAAGAEVVENGADLERLTSRVHAAHTDGEGGLNPRLGPALRQVADGRRVVGELQVDAHYHSYLFDLDAEVGPT